MRRARHPRLGFELDVPDAWQVAALDDGLVAAAEETADEPAYPPGFAVSFGDLVGEAIDPASLAAQGLGHAVRWLTDLRLLDEEDVRLSNGLSARRTLATYRQGISSLTLEQWHAIHDGRALVLSAIAPTTDFVAMHELWHAMTASLRLDDDD